MLRYTNESVDFAISHNKWPVCFRAQEGEAKTELVTEFIIYFWLKYMSMMKSQPLPHSAIAQKILKYLLIHKDLMVKTWRNRIYYYSSGTTFEKITLELKEWMLNHSYPSASDSDEEPHECDYNGPPAEKLLKNVCIHVIPYKCLLYNYTNQLMFTIYVLL